MGEDDETVLVLDSAGYAAGHHGPLLRILLDQLDARAIRTVVCGPGSNEDGGWGDRPWRTAERAPVRAFRTGRRLYREALGWGWEQGATRLIDLNLDRSLLRFQHGATTPFRSGVLVLHGVKGFAPGLANGPATTARRIIERRAMRAIEATDRLAVVVHTETARATLADLGVASSVADYPVPRVPTPTPHADVDESMLLYVGDARSEKGLGELVAAVGAATTSYRLVAVGSVDERTRAAMSTADRVEHRGRVSDDELADLRARCAATVLPYQDGFRLREGASSVLIESIAAGCPVVLPAWMVSLIPAGYDGFVAASDSSVDSLAAALDDLSGRAQELRSVARELGPDLIARIHSPERYCRTLVDALRIDGQPATDT